MKYKILIIIVLFFFITKQSIVGAICFEKKTCAECIQELECNWCAIENPISNDHCYNAAESTNCPVDKIISPKSAMEVLQNNDLQVNPDKAFVQVQPQKVKVQLRRNEVYEMEFKYAQAYNYPIDLYYIMDLSASMNKSKTQLANVGEKIITTMRRITNNFNIGFGSFVDKTDLPFVSTVPKNLASPCTNCVPAYSFKNHLSLSDNEYFSREVRAAALSGNLDSPEGGFDALMQAMVCVEEIGWRKEARRIIVFSTDAAFHIAGDGKLAGIVEPNDAQCHMLDNMYRSGLDYDYPSISQIKYIARRDKFLLLFVVTKPVQRLYEALAKAIGDAKVDLLGDDSDIVEIIQKYYEEITDNLQLKIQNAPSIELNITSTTCTLHNNLTCSGITPGKEIAFKVALKPTACLEQNELITIQPGQLHERLEIELEVMCECNCTGTKEKAEECGGFGDLHCGTCKCGEGHSGKVCECSKNSIVSSDLSACRMTNSSEICSQRGKCICGECECDKGQNPNDVINGKFCECDNFSCPKNAANELCNNRGRCECGRCVCLGYTGDDCTCSLSNEQCLFNSEVCSGRGQCRCGECECESGYYSKYCEECSNCEAKQCSKFEPCVECTLYNTGVYKENCALACNAYVITSEPNDDFDVEHVKECRNRTNDYCYIVFKYVYKDGRYNILGEKELLCSKPLNVPVLVFSVIGSILLIGLITLIIWKLAITVHDRREYAKFINEREKSKWNREDNPLFKTPITNFRNPTYGNNQTLKAE